MVAEGKKGTRPPEKGWRALARRAPQDDAADDAGTQATEAAHPRRRSVPWPVAAVLATALVAVAVYAAWPLLAPAPPGSNAEEPLPSAAQSESPSSTPAPPLDADRTAAAPSPSSNDTAAASGTSPAPETQAVDGTASEAVASPPNSPAPSPTEEGTPVARPAAADNAASPPATPEPESTPESPAVDARLEALLARLDARLAETESADALDGLEQRLAALENDPARTRLDTTMEEWSLERAALQARLDDAMARLARLETDALQRAADDWRLASLVAASGALRGALGSSRGFAPALATFRAAARGDPELEAAATALEPFAGSGVPSLEALQARFPEAANAIARNAAAGNEDDWVDATLGKLRQLVTIRRTRGIDDPDSLDGRLIAAEDALLGGDLPLAIAIAEALGAGDAEGARTWLQDARARREADAAFEVLSRLTAARVAARWADAGDGS